MIATLSRAGIDATLQRLTTRRAPAGARITLARKHVYILPTRHGVVFGAVLLVMLIGAMNYNSSLGHLLTFTLSGLGFVALFHTYRNLAGLTVRVGRAQPAFAGGSARYTLHLQNSRAAARCAIRLCTRDGAEAMCDVPPAGEAAVTLETPAPMRGLKELGTITVVSEFPLGLFRAWAPLTPAATCLVYPRPGPPRKLEGATAAGGTVGGISERGVDDYAGLKEYRPGDAPRHIHWKAAARGDPLLVKEFAAAQSPQLWLRWSDAQGDTEARLRQLCRWVLDAEAAGAHYGLDIPRVHLGPAGGDAHRRRCLEALALFGSAP